MLVAPMAMLSLVLGVLGASSTFTNIAVIAVAVATLVYRNRAGECEIGADGVAVRWLGTKRFVPWTKVRAIEMVTNGSLLTIDGEPPLLVRPVANRGPELLHLRKDALHDRLLAAWKVPRAESDAALGERLARGGRPVAAWRKQLDAVREGDYRAGAPREEDLWRIVEDPAAAPDARAAAALALRGTDEAAGRLRIAADAVAAPQLRVALEHAADPAIDEAALDEALAQVAREG
jgi:hypothetical protein